MENNTNNNNVEEFMKKSIRILSQCVRSSLELPTKGTSDETIFAEYPQFKKILNGLSLKLLNNVQFLIDKQDGKGNMLDTAERKTLDDKFSILVEVNDRLLDKCNSIIYSMENNNEPEKVGSSAVVIELNRPNDNVDNNFKRQSVKLLSSSQVERPQLKFARAPDNSKIPFRPILTTKPNAIVSLESSLINKDEMDYPHPYGPELDAFKVPTCQLSPKPFGSMPKQLFDTEYEYIDTVERLEKLVRRLKTENEIAVDLEHHSMRTYLGLTCLIQISTRNSDFIIDALALHDYLDILNDVFTDSRILKVFHGCNSDLMWLQRDFGVYVVNMFDTGHACQLLDYPRKSLSYLLDRFCGVQADKKYQLFDWRVRPLEHEYIEYARTDTHYLLHIYDKLAKELDDRHQLEDLYEGCRRLCNLLYAKPSVDDNDYIEIARKSSESFNPRQLYALKRLWELRDNIAREEDESPIFVMPNRILLNIAKDLPRETSAVLACCSQDWKLPLLRKYVYDFQKICLEAYSESLSTKTKQTFKKKSSILDVLLSKHDRSKINDDESNSYPVDDNVIADKTKHSSNMFSDDGHVLPIASIESIIEVYLRLHPVEPQVMCADEDEEKQETIEENGENVMDAEHLEEETLSSVEIEPVNTDPSVCKEVQPLLTSVQQRKPPKSKPVEPFNYSVSIKKLKEQPNSQNEGKQFKPFKTKKFNRNKKFKG